MVAIVLIYAIHMNLFINSVKYADRNEVQKKKEMTPCDVQSNPYYMKQIKIILSQYITKSLIHKHM